MNAKDHLSRRRSIVLLQIVVVRRNARPVSIHSFVFEPVEYRQTIRSVRAFNDIYISCTTYHQVIGHRRTSFRIASHARVRSLNLKSCPFIIVRFHWRHLLFREFPHNATQCRKNASHVESRQLWGQIGIGGREPNFLRPSYVQSKTSILLRFTRVA